jgi:hypothetical protein
MALSRANILINIVQSSRKRIVGSESKYFENGKIIQEITITELKSKLQQFLMYLSKFPYVHT